jgi:hypothetical protein
MPRGVSGSLLGTVLLKVVLPDAVVPTPTLTPLFTKQIAGVCSPTTGTRDIPKLGKSHSR